jgi:hypothetical protein
MVLGGDIHQGESWQFAVAIAHLLEQHERLGDGNVHSGDQVIIATGEIDALSTEVKLINHLAQKCLRAQRQILQWQQMHCRIAFMVPADNYRQPLPDIQWALTPIESVSELEQYLIAKGLVPSAATLTQKPANRGLSGPSFNIQPIRQKLTNSMTFALKYSSKLVSNNTKLVGAGVALSAFIVILFLILPLEKPLITLAYEVKTLGQCADAEPVVFEFPDAAVAQLPELKLNELCELNLSLPKSVDSVWLIADSYALLPLTASEQDPRQWGIPLPTWQQASRQYTLMTFSDAPDESDKQSMLAYLLKLHKQGEDMNLQSLVDWSNQQSINAQFVQHKLIFEESF